MLIRGRFFHLLVHEAFLSLRSVDFESRWAQLGITVSPKHARVVDAAELCHEATEGLSVDVPRYQAEIPLLSDSEVCLVSDQVPVCTQNASRVLAKAAPVLP